MEKEESRLEVCVSGFSGYVKRRAARPTPSDTGRAGRVHSRESRAALHRAEAGERVSLFLYSLLPHIIRAVSPDDEDVYLISLRIGFGRGAGLRLSVSFLVSFISASANKFVSCCRS